ncbi:MAG: hypothetical protein K0R31_2286 [Clostridiales bacterium]|jgi:hypothetical protein|nr:hypothetical protein [Clostridiales bacterium]
MKQDRITYSILLIIGIYIVFEATKFKYFLQGVPGPGFLPTWIGILICLISVCSLIKVFIKKDVKQKKFIEKGEIKPLIVIIGSSVGLCVITPITGLMVSLGVMSGVVTRFGGAMSWKETIGTAIITPIFIYFLFNFFLGVPLPKGLL